MIIVRIPLLKILLFLLLFFSFSIWCFTGDKNSVGEYNPKQLLGNPRSTILNINNISMWASDNGVMERRLFDQTAGVGLHGATTIVNAGGFLWGGTLFGGSELPRIGGSTFKSGLQPGRIISPGIAENPANADVHIYRIRRDWATADLTNDAAEYYSIPLLDVTKQDIANLRAIYQRDWIEWPWQKGAPYYERNGIPGYQPDSSGLADSTTDEPGLGGADQVIWFVANDLDAATSRSLYGSEPIGIEMQITCWAYNHFEKLKNVIFQRSRIIYKGTGTTRPDSRIDSMYFAKWVDPDIGNYSDDFVGCDIDRNIGYAYNSTPEDAEFKKYNLPPAVVGYDFFQGPRVKRTGGVANWDLNKIDGYENLPMTTFTYFTPMSRITDYSISNSQTILGWWNLFRGYASNPITPPTCFKDPITNLCTHFELNGDPEMFAGWTDGIQEVAGDRRFAMISGPFSMAFGDTQEVVVGMNVGMGKNNRDGISVMKKIDDAAQDAYNLNFDFPAPVPNPHVKIVELDNQIILDWESDTASARKVEGYTSRGYRFETYTLYQYPLPTSPRDEAIVYEILDPTQPRFLYLTTDKFRNGPLVNGQKYYFAVTTRVYNPDPTMAEKRFESPINIQEAVPHSPNPGTVYPFSTGDVLSNVSNLRGDNDALVRLTVFDPSKPDGHFYKILFHRDGDPITNFYSKPLWSLVDSTTHDTLVHRLSVDSPPQRIVTRGFSIEAFLPRHGLKGVFQVQSGGHYTHDTVFNKPNPEGTVMVVGPGASILDTLMSNYPGDRDIELRFTGDSCWSFLRDDRGALYSKWLRVPFTAWERYLVGTDTFQRQLYTVIIKEGDDTLWQPKDYLHRTYNGKSLKVFPALAIVVDSLRIGFNYLWGKYYDDAPFRSDMPQLRAFLWIHGQYYSKKVNISRAYIADMDDDGVPAPIGTIIRFEHVHEIRNGEEKLFSWSEVVNNDYIAAKREVARVNVFPNPYYGINRAEIARFQKFVTFSHLPQYATIRIFNLAGILVKTIHKDDTDQFIQWDLNNENGLPVAGGLYLAHIQMKMGNQDLGEKTLKLMIVPGDKSPENN